MRVFFLVMAFVMAFAPARALTPADREEVERLRIYLNNITTMQARFVQSDGAGGTASGSFWLHRPGRLRFEYDPPTPILVVARGSFLVHFDKDLKEANYLDQEDTPAWFLLADEVTWDDDFIIQDVSRAGPLVEVAATRRSAPDQGAVTLVFERDPIKLLGWWLGDASGRRIQVRLETQAHGVAIDPETFQFRPTDY